MRHYKSYITMALAAFALFFVSCSDEYMEEHEYRSLKG